MEFAQAAVPPSRRDKLTAVGLTLLLIVLALTALLGAKPPTPSYAGYPRELGRVTFVAAGDVIPHQAVVQAATAFSQVSTPSLPSPLPAPPAPPPAAGNHDGWDPLFGEVAEVFRRADFGFVNLETPVAPHSSRGAQPFQFVAPVALLEALKFSGVKLVSFANNHVFDQGQAGFAETLEHLGAAGILAAGAGSNAAAAWRPVIVEKNGIKVGWLGMTRWLNGHRNPEREADPHVAFVPYPGEADGAPGLTEAEVIEAVKAARAQCDLLVVSIHWGVEYAPAPRPQDVSFAHAMLEAGASAIIGHHPHVLQPIETYLTQDQRTAVIFYSLGNFLSNQSRFYVNGLMPDRTGEPRDSLLVKFAVVKKDYGPAGVRAELAGVGILPAWTENNDLLFRSGQAPSRVIRPILMDRELPRLQVRLDELARLGDQASADDKKEMLRLARALELLRHRRELLLERTGDEFLVAP